MINRSKRSVKPVAKGRSDFFQGKPKRTIGMPPARPVTRVKKSSAVSQSSGMGGRSVNYLKRPMRRAPKRLFKEPPGEN